MTFERRLAAAVRTAAAAGVQGLIATAGPDARYLSGFTGSAGLLLVHDDGAILVTDGRYGEQAEAEVGATADVTLSALGTAKGLATVLPGSVERLGFDPARLTVAGLSALEEALPDVRWEALAAGVAPGRASKVAAERAAIASAQRLAEEVLLEVADWIEPGRTEREVAAEIDVRCARRGAEAMSFPTIVAAGERSALPHARPSSRAIAEDEPVMIDMGCVVDGYCSDITRMVWVGARPTSAWLEVVTAVTDAQQAAIEAVAPGVAAHDVDGAARAVLARAGLGSRFTHGVGHGVGLEIHEAPRVAARSDAVLEPGNVFTVEPGVYLPGEFGVRIEDIVIVTEEGHERVTRLGTEPILAGARGERSASKPAS